jgi:hypothetical protein
MKTVLTTKNAYKEDVSTKAAGSALVAYPCVVYSITASAEQAGDSVVNIANHATTYSQTNRIEQICLTDEQHTVQLVYPNGKIFSAGLVATCNKSGVDLSVTFE